jgi:hypothetical protein
MLWKEIETIDNTRPDAYLKAPMPKPPIARPIVSVEMEEAKHWKAEPMQKITFMQPRIVE